MKTLQRIAAFVAILLSCHTGFAQSWEQLDTIHVSHRIGAAACVAAGKGYVGFGHDYNTRYPFNDLWEYDPKQGRWRNVDYFEGQFRTHAFMFACADAIYFGGGTRDSGRTALSTFVKYDLRTKQLQRLKDLPFERAVGATAIKLSDSVVYLIGGCTTAACDSNMYIYHTATDSWTVIAKNIRPGRFGFAFLLDSMIYTGLQTHDEVNPFPDTYRYDLRKAAWSFGKPFIGKPRTRVVCGVIDGRRAFVGLGTRIRATNVYPANITDLKQGVAKKLTSSFFDDIYVYNSTTRKWKALRRMDKARRSAVAFYLDGYLYAGMGNIEHLILRDFQRLKMKE